VHCQCADNVKVSLLVWRTRYNDTFCNAVDCLFELALEVQRWTRARSECLPGGGKNCSYATGPIGRRGVGVGAQQQMRAACHVDMRRRRLNTDLLKMQACLLTLHILCHTSRASELSESSCNVMSAASPGRTRRNCPVCVVSASAV